MNTIGAFLDLSATLEKDQFLKAHPMPFLVTIEEQRGGVPSSLAPGGDLTQAATVCQSPSGLRQASIAARDARIYVIAKREGANTSPDILVGRSRENDVWIDDAEVSKRHARFRSGQGGLELLDMGSTNGTFVNEKKIEKETAVAVKPNDSIRFGRAAKTQLLDADSFFDYLTLLRRFVGL
jgi:hypothetical protein